MRPMLEDPEGIHALFWAYGLWKEGRAIDGDGSALSEPARMIEAFAVIDAANAEVETERKRQQSVADRRQQMLARASGRK